MKPRDLLPNTEIYKQFIPGRPFFCRGIYDYGVKDEYKINGLELVTLTANDRNGEFVKKNNIKRQQEYKKVILFFFRSKMETR